MVGIGATPFSAEVDDGLPMSALNRPFSSASHNSSYIGIGVDRIQLIYFYSGNCLICPELYFVCYRLPNCLYNKAVSNN